VGTPCGGIGPEFFLDLREQEQTETKIAAAKNIKRVFFIWVSFKTKRQTTSQSASAKKLNAATLSALTYHNIFQEKKQALFLNVNIWNIR
jgi:hypothetical protein